MAAAQNVEVEGRVLALTKLDKRAPPYPRSDPHHQVSKSDCLRKDG
jgi:hypothetical protein